VWAKKKKSHCCGGHIPLLWIWELNGGANKSMYIPKKTRKTVTATYRAQCAKPNRLWARFFRWARMASSTLHPQHAATSVLWKINYFIFFTRSWEIWQYENRKFSLARCAGSLQGIFSMPGVGFKYGCRGEEAKIPSNTACCALLRTELRRNHQYPASCKPEFFASSRRALTPSPGEGGLSNDKHHSAEQGRQAPPVHPRPIMLSPSSTMIPQTC
jgi:hypothetical protein